MNFSIIGRIMNWYHKFSSKNIQLSPKIRKDIFFVAKNIIDHWDDIFDPNKKGYAQHIDFYNKYINFNKS